jgi:hypothetical protein
MESGLRARHNSARTSAKPRASRLNGIELFMFGLIALALVDFAVIGLLIARGFGN